MLDMSDLPCDIKSSGVNKLTKKSMIKTVSRMTQRMTVIGVVFSTKAVISGTIIIEQVTATNYKFILMSF